MKTLLSLSFVVAAFSLFVSFAPTHAAERHPAGVAARHAEQIDLSARRYRRHVYRYPRRYVRPYYYAPYYAPRYYYPYYYPYGYYPYYYRRPGFYFGFGF